MRNKKTPPKVLLKAARPKRASNLKVSGLLLESDSTIRGRGGSARNNLGKMLTVWGASDDLPSDIDWTKVPRMPNPMPDNIISLLKLAGEASWLTIPLAPYIYILIKAWFDGRASRKLKIRNGDFEIEFQGGWSERKIRNAFNQFRKLTKDLDEDRIQVIENGKVIERGDGPAYKVKRTDTERARESRADEARTMTAIKRKRK